MDEQKIYRAALAAWGADAQTLMVFEEMSELQKELCKAARGKDNTEQIAEEIADVEIMLEQMKVLHRCAEAVAAYQQSKLRRLAVRSGSRRKERKAMTIDEAIAHAREVAEGCRAENGDCAYQHDKLTEWLVELKAYRETGLKPEEIADFREMYREMAAKFADYKAAEVTGQLVVFPCRVTDTVYYIETVHKGRKYAGGRVVSAQIDHVTIGGTTGKPVFDLCTETENWLYALEPGEFFLTREEAEKALEEGRKNGEY